MSILSLDKIGFSEKELEKNWAAAYAKRLNDSLSDTVENHVAALEGADRDVLTAAEGYADTAAKTAVSVHKTAAVLDHPNGSVTNEKLADYCVNTIKIAQGAINNNRISNGAVDARAILDGSVTTAKIADGAVTAEKLADGSVTNEKLADGSVTADKLADICIMPEMLEDKSVTIEKLADSLRSSYDGTTGVLTAPILKELSINSGQPYNLDVAEINGHPLRDDTARAEAAKATKFYVSDSAPTYTTAGNIGDIAAVKTDSETDPYNPIYMCLGKVSKIVLADGRTLGGTGLYKWINISEPMSAVAQLQQYSTIPQRIGTWIDGTPIWRQAIPPVKIESPGVIHVADYLSVNGDADVIILKSDVFVQNNMSDCDSEATADTETYELKCENRLIHIKSIDDSVYSDHPQMWYGVVEFVSPESNIITT
ncbi:MAG: hypothetical protein ACI38A_07345 [Candidatus Ornithomonoglobus sp.]